MMRAPIISVRARRIAALAVASIMLGLASSSGAPTSATAPAPAASPHHVSSLMNEPGYVPLVDPESTADSIGRRLNAPAVSQPFHGGAPSLEALGRTVCRQLEHQRRDSLLALCVSDSEFRDILWREFPQSRPATGLTWQDAWTMLYARLHAGCSHAVRDYGGHSYAFVGFERDSVFAYRNFRMHNHLVLVARDDAGDLHRMRWLRSVAERRGRFKIYSTED